MKFLDLFKKKIQDCNFSFLPDGVFVLEHDGRIIDVNEKILELYHTTKFNIIGRYFSDFVENGTAILNEIIKDKSYKVVHAISKFDDGRMFLEISALRTHGGEKVYVCARNVTEKETHNQIINEKYSSAQQILEGKNDFILCVSDNVLSSLVTMSGFSRALLDGMGGALSEKQEKYLNIINTNAKSLCYDLEKLFTLFKIESSKIEYNCKNFNLVDLIKSVDRIYQKDFNDKNLPLNLDYSALTNRDCYLDPEVLEYILRCILDIFLRFSTLGKCSLNIGHPPVDFLKTKEFRANVDPDNTKYALFEAKITDLVLAPEEIENIFNTYHKSLQKRPIGLKATMSILKMYINDFGGDIWIYSKQNVGTMFTFVLPLRKI